MTQIDLAYLLVLCASINISYLVGKRIGIENTLDYLESKEVIEFDE